MESNTPVEGKTREIQAVLDSVQKDTFEDRAFGCTLGAFAGDACGTIYEFNKSLLSEQEMDIAMTYPGGGPFELGPGQITDDSEMALCLL